MTLFLPGMQDSVENLATCQSVSRSWCDPTNYVEVVGIDFGCNSAHFYMARSGRHGKLSFGELLGWLRRLPARTLVVCESAHLGVPQTELSLAQPFTAEQLLNLYRAIAERDITLKLAPHSHTGKRMRLWVARRYPDLMRGTEKSDAADAVSLAIYVDRCNEVALANPYDSFRRDARREFGREVSRLSNSILNAERTNDYRGSFYPLIIKLSRHVRRHGDVGPNIKFVATVASTLAWEKDGRLLLFTHRGQVPGRWFWMRNVLRMSAWHHRAGVARSNLMWHAFRPYLARRAGASVKQGNSYRKFADFSDKQNLSRISAMGSYRNLLLRCRDVCISEALKMGAGHLELTDTNLEVSSGR